MKMFSSGWSATLAVSFFPRASSANPRMALRLFLPCLCGGDKGGRTSPDLSRSRTIIGGGVIDKDAWPG